MEKIVSRNKRYGWIPDIPDFRDFKFKTADHILKTLPPAVDLRNPKLPIFNQLQLGSCSGQAIAAAHMFDQLKQNFSNVFIPSRLFIYYNERYMEGHVGEDSGAQIRDGVKSINSQGVCPETDWAYDISKFTQKPPDNCYKEAVEYESVQYERVAQTEEELKGCLASGFPFVFGFAVYESFESQEVARTGIVPMPSTKEKMLGGHAVIAMSYSDADKRFTIQNSWSNSWGQNGFFTIPYEYLLNGDLAADFWVIKLIKSGSITPTPTPTPVHKSFWDYFNPLNWFSQER